jgi:probable addiction module antidote protein
MSNYVAQAIAVVARAQGMSAIARDAGVSRVCLYRALSAKTNLSMVTMMKVLSALGVQLVAKPTTEPRFHADLGPGVTQAGRRRASL